MQPLRSREAFGGPLVTVCDTGHSPAQEIVQFEKLPVMNSSVVGSLAHTRARGLTVDANFS